MHPTPRAATLLAPVRQVLDVALEALGAPDVTVDVDEVAGVYALRDGTVVLSTALEGPALQLAGEREDGTGLDRWRRAAAAVLEGAVLRDLPDGPPWLRLGLAILRADRAAPDLRLAAPDLADAATGDLVAHPRAGIAVLRAWEALGHDADARALQQLQAGVVDVKDWVDAAVWWVDEGLGRLAPTAARAPAVDVPVTLGPWSWVRLAVPAHGRGGRLRVKGRGGVVPAWAAADTPYTGVAAACGAGARIQTEPGGPLGTWEVRSAEGFGQVYGARGLTYVFHASGKLEVVLADAFVGSLSDLEAGEAVGTSGVATGRWRVAGPRRLSLHDVIPQGVTLHGREGETFAVPADGFGLAATLRAMEEGTWTWHEEGADRLRLEGRMFGGPVAIRLCAPDAVLDA